MCITINLTSGYKEVFCRIQNMLSNNKCKNNKRIWNNIRETSEAFESELKVLHGTLLGKLSTWASSNCYICAKSCNTILRFERDIILRVNQHYSRQIECLSTQVKNIWLDPFWQACYKCPLFEPTPSSRVPTPVTEWDTFGITARPLFSQSAQYSFWDKMLTELCFLSIQMFLQ